MSEAARIERVRLDVWLDVACLFKTRSEAQRACHGGKVDVNGARAKAHREVRVGDELVIKRPFGRSQRVIIRRLADRHIAKTEARALYEDLTPPPTPEERDLRRMTALSRPWRLAAGSPDKRERRDLRRLKGFDD
jgi:ribosome-associated heat shock protein Hsp15